MFDRTRWTIAPGGPRFDCTTMVARSHFPQCLFDLIYLQDDTGMAKSLIPLSLSSFTLLVVLGRLGMQDTTSLCTKFVSNKRIQFSAKLGFNLS